MKNQLHVITGNLPGSIVGAIALFYAAKKVGGISSHWGIAIAVIVGAAVGANVQASMKASTGAAKSAAVVK